MVRIGHLRPFSSPRASAIVPIAISPSRQPTAGPSPTQSMRSTTDGTSNNSVRSLGPPRQKTARVQPLRPRDAHIQERGKLDVWMLGLTIVIGGQYVSWNAGLSAGLGSYLIGFVLVTAAYITLCCCTAEIAGALPFAGGAYGLSRCTLGFFPGFMIGCCEALEYIAYVSTTVISLADMIVQTAPTVKGLEPLIWLLFYVSALAIQLKGGRFFWGFNLAIGSISLFAVLVFVFGSLPFVDFGKNASGDPNVGFVGGFSGFLRVLPIATWFYVGVEALPMASDDVLRPKTIVPKAQVTCILTLALTGLMVFFVTVSLPPGPGGLAMLAQSLAPLNPGFELMFKISSNTATLISLPATYATAFGFIWCYGKLIHAMSTSRLLPQILSRTIELSGVPYVALLVGSAVSYGLCVVVYCLPHISKHLFPICITSAFVAYTGQCIGYISLKKNYRNIKSSYFTNPFGIPGAVFSMVVWILGLLSIAGFQEDDQVELLSFIAIVLLVASVYHGYAKKRQTFSPQENKVLLVAHVTKFNASRFNAKTKSKSKTSHGNSRHQTNQSSQAQNSLRQGGAGSNVSEAESTSPVAMVRPFDPSSRSAGHSDS